MGEKLGIGNGIFPAPPHAKRKQLSPSYAEQRMVDVQSVSLPPVQKAPLHLRQLGSVSPVLDVIGLLQVGHQLLGTVRNLAILRRENSVR